jgi:hypothetical protein
MAGIAWKAVRLSAVAVRFVAIDRLPGSLEDAGDQMQQ